MNILDLGLLRSCSVDETGEVHIVIGTTTPVCLMIGSIVAAIEQEVARVADVTAVNVRIDTATVWMPELMSESARAALDLRRSHLVKEKELVPRRWEQTLHAVEDRPDKA